MTDRLLPSAPYLPRAVYSGWACVWCHTSLRTSAGGVLAGRAEGRIGVHDMSVDVYSCPDCASPRPAHSDPRSPGGA